MSPRILLFDRAAPLADALRHQGYEVAAYPDPEEAAGHLRSAGADVALGDIGEAAAGLLSEALALPDGPEVVLLDDFGSADQAVEAIRQGAFDVLARPVTDDQILLVIARALEHRNLERENRRLRHDLGDRFAFGRMESGDGRMRHVFRTLESVADSRANLLITGESGTGKTMLARAVHRASPRAEEAFVEVNCGALPDNLLESELFGHAKGAFTGAVADRAGKFEAADGGTLFLDEIATASPELQVKLLRVLEDRAYERVGDDHTRRVDVRLICATNRDLAEEVRAGRFREDLLYRIDVVSVEVPPLRERPGDIPHLVETFRERFARDHGRPVRSVDPRALERLCAQPWPGNVRELENTVERGVLLARGSVLGVTDLWPDAAAPIGSAGGSTGPGEPASELPWDRLPLGPLKEVLEIPEKALIVRALEFHGGNRQKTAGTLGINRTTLFNKMRKYDLLSFPAGHRKDA